MRIEDVFGRFALMADLSEDEAEKFKPLCQDAVTEISRSIKDNDPKAQGILCAAAAALALYRWSLITASFGCESFSAGDVKVTKDNENVSMAKQMWLEAAGAAAPYLTDSGFVFERI